MDESTGEVLLEKDASTSAPIASMTKLMTAMVVLDAQLPAEDIIRISTDDLDTLKGTTSGVPVGATATRHDLLQLALIASDNHAAAALARTYPGSRTAFLAAVQQKITQLGLEQTVIVEPTGLSPRNHASAHDMARILKAASTYPLIQDATSRSSQWVQVSGRPRQIHNTNHLVGAPGWDIQVSKTGYTREAGLCVSMRMQSAGRNVLVVLMGAMGRSVRMHDAFSVQRWLGAPVPDFTTTPLRRVSASARMERRVAAGKLHKAKGSRKAYHRRRHYGTPTPA
jgi:D-alanyl-D-alanine carboxypeptidase/D-alanyl-D-alanine endopeptidase (penicillin-binding protein 7)